MAVSDMVDQPVKPELAGLLGSSRRGAKLGKNFGGAF
jgi:hypothetical protein